MRGTRRNIICYLFLISIIALLLMSTALSEHDVWDCPCGRTCNTGNYCGGCGRPAPTNPPFPTAAPASTLQPATIPTPETVLNTLKVGDNIVFGNYEQDNNLDNGKEGIEWIVLDVSNDKYLLLSKYGLEPKAFNTKRIHITWENSSLRKWLNEDFLYTAFCEDERSAILITNTEENTQDSVFLLSYKEAFEQYLPEKDMRKCAPTEYAKSKGAMTGSNYTFDKLAGAWWLRSPGNYDLSALYIIDDGGLWDQFVDINDIVVRPALWLNSKYLSLPMR